MYLSESAHERIVNEIAEKIEELNLGRTEVKRIPNKRRLRP